MLLLVCKKGDSGVILLRAAKSEQEQDFDVMPNLFPPIDVSIIDYFPALFVCMLDMAFQGHNC